MSFARDDRTSIFGALRPCPEQVVERAVVATYSLDLIALLGLVLALGGQGEAEYEASPLGLVHAFEGMRGRLTVLHQRGRIIAPRAHRDVLPLLDTMVQAIPANERAQSWHPKVALVRYLAQGRQEWRFWIGSRNLTGSTDRDAGLLLVSGTGRGTRPLPAIADLAADLLAEARWAPEELAALRALRWRAPAGVEVRALRWRRPGQTRRFLTAPLIASPDRACAVSPFLNTKGLAEALDAACTSLTLLTTGWDAAKWAPHEGVRFRIDAAPEPASPVLVEAQQGEADGDFIEPPSTGVHAKLLAASRGERTALMLGSANLTDRGLIGPNAEAVVILDMTDPDLAKSLYAFVDSGLEFTPSPPDMESLEAEKAERRLDDAVARFLDLDLALSYDDEGLVLAIGEGTIPADARFAAAPFLDPDAWTPLPPGSRRVVLAKSLPPLSERTCLVSFRARSIEGPDVARVWVQALAVNGIDEGRDHALIARYVGAARFREWLRSQMEGVDGTGGQTWADVRGRAAAPFGAGAGRLGDLFTLETMLAAWARDPIAFEGRMARAPKMLDAFQDAFAVLEDEAERAAALNELKEVRPFLDALMQAIGVR